MSTTTFKAIIVDDEESARDLLGSLVEKFCPQLDVVQKCHDLEHAVAAIEEHQPDLVFLDIEMPNYAGYEIVSFFEEINFDIIFVTAYDNYAIKAFEISAVDYLLKPVHIDRLKIAVERFQEKTALKGMKNAYEVLKENLQKPNLTKIVIPHNGEQKIIATTTILAIEAREAYAMIHTNSGGRYMVSKNLKHFENLLAEHELFFRSHKSWLINLNKITSYSRSELKITLENGDHAKLSKYKKSDFEERFAPYRGG